MKRNEYIVKILPLEIGSVDGVITVTPESDINVETQRNCYTKIKIINETICDFSIY